MTDLVKRHEELVPMGCMVSSKGRFRNCAGFGPAWIQSASGAYVYDDEGKAYLDWSCGLGALSLGHRDVMDPAPACYPLPSTCELTLAEMICSVVPCAEQVRFMKSGTDAVSAAVRLARIHTGRDKILDAGSYHGWQDWSITSEHEGVPKCVRDLTVRMPFNDVDTAELRLRTKEFACLVLEPVSLIAPNAGYLMRLRELCDLTGTVLIFDEVITGIRMAPGGAQEVYDVVPHLCAIGKGMANGHPISAVCGDRAIMSCWSRTHMSGTHFGEPNAMRAAIDTMKKMKYADFWKHQKAIGGRMMDATRNLLTSFPALEGHVEMLGHPHWWVLKIKHNEEQTLMQQECVRRGVLASNGSHFVSLAHTAKDVAQTIMVYGEALTILDHAIRNRDVKARLECQPNRTTFQRSQ